MIFAIADERMVLLHGFVKKTKWAPKADLDLAAGRRRDINR